jgi:hypothetical protein
MDVVQPVDKDIQYIEDLSTIISFGDIEQPIFILFRDKRPQEFGETPIYTCTTANGFFFKEISKIKNIDDPTLIQIASGQSIYCKNILKKDLLDLHKSEGQVIVSCGDKNSADINKVFIKKIINEFKTFYLLTLKNQDKEQNVQNAQNTKYQTVL